MAFWGIELKSAKPYTHSPSSGRLRISQATLGFGTGDGRSVVQCNVVNKSPVLLCSLLPEKAESCRLELEFDESEQVTFSVIGPHSVHLTGYYLPHSHRTSTMVANDDTESYGEDIGHTNSSDYRTDDEYGGSFIDDDDVLYVSTPSSSPCDNAFKMKTKKKKSDVAKPGCKRLKKKYEVSDSEDNAGNSARRLSLDLPLESDEDKFPISSLRGLPKSKYEELKRRKQHVADYSRAEIMKKKRKIDKENSISVEVRSIVGLDKDRTKSATKHRKTMLENGIKADSDGLLVEDFITGKQDGKVASTGKKVSIHYTGMLETSGKVFDSSIGKKPLKFGLGEGLVLDGMDRGIVGMQVGGKRRLIIPPKLGYGSDGTERVPANSWLIMEVELLRVHK